MKWCARRTWAGSEHYCTTSKDYFDTAWRRNSGIIWKKSSECEVMTRFLVGLFGRNFNLTSGETFSGVEWYTRFTRVGAFKWKSYNIAQCLHLLAGGIWVYFYGNRRIYFTRVFYDNLYESTRKYLNLRKLSCLESNFLNGRLVYYVNTLRNLIFVADRTFCKHFNTRIR